MAVRIVIDSSCDLTKEEAEALGYDYVPLMTIFGNEEYRDGIDLTNEEFFNKLIEGDIHPTTSQPTPGEFKEIFEGILADGDEAVVICLSSKLSGTYQSAVFACQSLNAYDKIFVVDSLSVTVGEAILAKTADKMRKEGKSAQEIVKVLEEEKGKLRIIALLDTLEYLKKGGRISATAAAVGSLLSIKPVIAIENGEVVVLGKARGSKAGNNLLRKFLIEKGPIDFEKDFSLLYSGFSDALLMKYVADSKGIYEEHVNGPLPIGKIGSTIGTHIGPGAIGLCFHVKE